MKSRNNRNFNNGSNLIYTIPVVASLVLLATALILLFENDELIQTKSMEISSEVEYKTWTEANHQNYSFLLNSSCHSAYDTLIEVRDGEVVYPKGPDYQYPTIEQLFQLIEKGKSKADSFSAYYHSLGFPQYVNINWEEDIYDFACGFDLRDFRILGGLGPVPSVNYKKRIKEKRFVPPGMLELEDYVNEIWTKEEREAWAKKYIHPGSQDETNFEHPPQNIN